MELFRRYGKQYELLKQMLGNRISKFPRQRLNEIFMVTEKKWEENLDRYAGKEVEYLLIAEAPPWTPENRDEIKFFYNTFSQPLKSRIWKTFFDSPAPNNVNLSLDQLAMNRFLLVDSVPFAIKYESRDRRKGIYTDLVRQSAPYLMKKLQHKNVKLSRDIRVAIGFRLNGIAMIEAYTKKISLNTGRVLKLNDGIIATDGSGYPNSEKLREIFGYNGHNSH